MNKAILIAVPVVVIGGALWFYPQFQAPKAHEIIQEHLVGLKSQLESSNSGNLTIVKHDTDTSGSDIEVDWELVTAREFQTVGFPETVSLNTKAQVALSSLPSAKGFKSITSTTTSAQIDAALKEQGSTEGFVMDCVTVPTSAGYDTDCTTNSITLKNTAEDEVNAVDTITMAAVKLAFDIDEEDKRYALDISMPELNASAPEEKSAIISGISLSAGSPYDLEKGTISDALMGRVSIDGDTTMSFEVKDITIQPKGTAEPLLIKGIKSDMTSSIVDGLASGDFLIKSGAITGAPYEISELRYSGKIANWDNEAMVKLNTLFASVSPPMDSAATSPPPVDMERLTDILASMLAKGPELSIEISADQPSGNIFTIGTQSEFKENTKENVQKILDQFMGNSNQDPMTLLPVALENLALTINAAIDQSFAEQISMMTAAARPQSSAMSPEDLQAAAAQNIAMLEMMGIVKRKDDTFTSSFNLDEKGLFLNGKDISALLGLPPQ